MAVRKVHSLACGAWVAPGKDARPVFSAVTGRQVALVGGGAADVGAMLEFARTRGGPALRAMTFHDRARMLKALAQHLSEHKRPLYELAHDTGATPADSRIDIDGGIGTLFVIASKGRREMPDGRVFVDGQPEQLSRGGSFMGLHVCTPLQGVAVHINAFNFPVWGMLEKLAPTLLAGVPAIVKPATASCYVTEACVRLIAESGILPEGALQMIAGGTGDLLDRLGGQDVVSFTGSRETALRLRATPNILAGSVRFIAEQDSLNASILGPDVAPGSTEFGLFVSEVRREMTVKAGQKCTAIRRVILPEPHVDAFIADLTAQLERVRVGNPRAEGVDMGALISVAQKADVLEAVRTLSREVEPVFGNPDDFPVVEADREKGAFLPPMLFFCADPDRARRVHDTEAFGPVSTVMGYRDLEHAVELANRGEGSLVASVVTASGRVAREVTLRAGAYHGRLYFNNARSMAEATGHGAPLPHMVHGGPGRAGGGEELGGIRGVLHYMQRTALQGSPDILSAISDSWLPGAGQPAPPAHPFRLRFDALRIGQTLHTESRRIALEDIEHFARFTGDLFYAHMDEDAAAANPFFPGRVAHGYLLLSFAAGLFVDPAPGPVLANTGLDGLRFLKPVVPGDSIRASLTVKRKTRRNDDYGEVRWHVTLKNQDDETVAEYELLTMVAS